MISARLDRGDYGGRVTSSDMSDEDLLANWELITRAVVRTQERVLNRIEVGGLSSLWFAALHLLLRSSEHRLPMSHLARELSITTGGFTKLADRMGQEGLIDRRNSSGDRRVVYAALTEEGLRVARRSERQYKAALREHVLEVLTAEKLVGLAESAGVLDGAAWADIAEEVRTPAAAPQRSAGLPDRRRRPVPDGA
ncbi:MAG: MarR family transcriptional regulator [Pseudonocardiales bacterium]|nr:MAG: MarR family transcriptional regulator [Pseudonocardiales bacterium]